MLTWSCTFQILIVVIVIIVIIIVIIVVITIIIKIYNLDHKGLEKFALAHFSSIKMKVMYYKHKNHWHSDVSFSAKSFTICKKRNRDSNNKILS